MGWIREGRKSIKKERELRKAGNFRVHEIEPLICANCGALFDVNFSKTCPICIIYKGETNG